MLHRQTHIALDLGVLDALRGLAAVYVVLHHSQWLLSSPADANPSGVAGRILSLLSGSLHFGHQAVLVFFLISGFCIHYRQARVLAQEPRTQPSWRLPLELGPYAWRRLRRLYPPLLVALGLTALLDSLGMYLNPAFYSGQGTYEHINRLLISVGDHQWSTLFGNAGFQGSLLVGAWGTDTPLWSLAYEFWYYALYPVLLVASARFGARGMLALAGGVAAAGLAALLYDASWAGAWAARVLSYWVVWTIGAAIAEGYVGRLRVHSLALRALTPVALLCVAVLAANALNPRVQLQQQVEDLLWSGALAVLLGCLVLACPARLAERVQRTVVRLAPLGNISYSLYVVHMPWLALVSAWWLSSHATLPNGIELQLFGICGAFGLAAACWFFVERHCVSQRATPKPERLPHAVPAMSTMAFSTSSQQSS